MPALVPFTSVLASNTNQNQEAPTKVPVIKFFGDGEMFEPAEHLNELQKAQASAAIVKDRYGEGGAVEELEKKFAPITGKEKAIYMPSGTMANQLAIAVLSGENTKVFVQETSHVYRDEGDAAVDQTTAWKLFTSDQKLKKWAAPLAHIELKSGGYLITKNDSTKKLSDSSSIKLPVISFLDNELLVLKVSLNDNFAQTVRDTDENLQEIIQFKKVGYKNTKIISSMIGWGKGNDWGKNV